LKALVLLLARSGLGRDALRFAVRRVGRRRLAWLLWLVISRTISRRR